MNVREAGNVGQEVALESWKEIAAYLGRQVKTVQRWEKEERLPIHRHNHKSRSSVYAYPGEIDAWRASRKVTAEAAPARSLWRFPAFALTALLCLVMVGNGIRPEAASAQQGPAVKRVLVPKSDIEYFTLSPDGQWIGGTDWVKGDLVLTRISTGETKRLVTAAFDKVSATWGESPLLSPDQKQIAYWWFDDSAPQARGQVRLMPNAPGAKSRVLVNATGGSDGAYPIGWSPDGKRILVELGKLDQNRRSRDIAWASVADGSVQVIKTLDSWNSGKGVTIRLSPDGRYIAYSAWMRPDTPDTGIYVLSADGATQSELVGGGTNAEPVWTPDGNHILFSSNRSGSFGIWSVPVRDGKSAGIPSLVKPETSIVRSLGISHSGRYFYDYKTGSQQILIAEMDPVTGKARGSAVTESFVGILPAWSRDGKWLAFKRPGNEPSIGYTPYDLIIHSMDRGTEWNMAKLQDSQPVWFLDGSVQINGNPKRVSVKSGQPEIITAPVRLPLGELSPDDKLLYTGTNTGMSVIDAATGEQIRTFPVPGGFIFFAVSPDGKTLSMVGGENSPLHLSRIATDGSDYRELFSGVSLGKPVWTKNGRAILFGQRDKNSKVDRIMRIPAEGGQPEFAGIGVEDLYGFDLSPDGSKIAYGGGSNNGEVRALDNVLSALK